MPSSTLSHHTPQIYSISLSGAQLLEFSLEELLCEFIQRKNEYLRNLCSAIYCDREQEELKILKQQENFFLFRKFFEIKFEIYQIVLNQIVSSVQMVYMVENIPRNHRMWIQVSILNSLCKLSFISYIPELNYLVSQPDSLPICCMASIRLENTFSRYFSCLCTFILRINVSFFDCVIAVVFVKQFYFQKLIQLLSIVLKMLPSFLLNIFSKIFEIIHITIKLAAISSAQFLQLRSTEITRKMSLFL